MGHCKLLLPFGGTTVIGRVIEVLEAALLPEIIVVVSVKADDVAAEAAKHRVTVARNDIPDGDMVSSLKRGRSLVSPEAAAVLVALADYPLVATSTITTLLDESAKLPGLIVIPCCNGRRGHPVVIPLPLLDGIEHGESLRGLIRRNSSKVRLLEVDDPGILNDIDTPEDYRKALCLI